MANKLQNKSDLFKIINITELARITKIDYHTLRNNIVGVYDSLNTDQDRTRIYNGIRDGVEKACLAIGFTYEGKPVKKVK